MTTPLLTSFRLAYATVLLPAVLLASCSPEQRRVVTALGQMEQADFNYLVLPADANGDFTLPLPSPPDGACRGFRLSRNELGNLLRDRQLVVGNNVTVPFTFDALEKCQPSQPDPARPPFPEVKITNDDLSEAATDAAGAPIRVRPNSGALLGGKLVDARLSGSGQFSFVDKTRGINLVGMISSGSKQPGPGTFSAAEFRPGLFGYSGADFVLDPGSDYYTGLELTSVASNPERFTATFALTAVQAGAPVQLVLIWDGDLVLRTDL